jgi:hypothetical protein
MPDTSSASISSVVATGLSMKGRETELTFGSACIRHRYAGCDRFGHRTFDLHHFAAFAQPVDALQHHQFASSDALVHGGPAVDSGALSEEDAEAVEAYVVSQALGSIELCQSEYRKNYPEVIETACVRAEETGAE